MKERPHPWVTVIVQTDGSLETKQVRLPKWGARALLIAAAALAALIVLAAAFYLPVARTAARVPGLERRVARLEAENAKIADLARALDSADARYARVRSMIGADIVPDPLVRCFQVQALSGFWDVYRLARLEEGQRLEPHIYGGFRDLL
jgi:hypothetical protein